MRVFTVEAGWRAQRSVPGGDDAVAGRGAALAIQVLLAVLGFRQLLAAQWLLALSILAEGLTGLMGGALEPLAQYWEKPRFILVRGMRTGGPIQLAMQNKRQKKLV